MVKVIGYQTRKSEEGNEFFVLILQGGIEIVKSQNGGMYATARQISLPCTFNEESCKLLVGQELKGEIQKIECAPYEYIVPSTGEVITLSHKYQYVPLEVNTAKSEGQFISIPGFKEVYRPSKNGHLSHA